MIKTAIIGCGEIAGGYDERKKSEGVFTHAGAYKSISGIEIDAAFDINPSRLSEFCRFWKVKRQCTSIDDLLFDKYDIVSVCTSDNTHEEIMEKVIEAGCTKYIWAEKPLTNSVVGAEKVLRMAKEKAIGIWLSNQRRWEPGHITARKLIQEGRIGNVIHATGYYVKGIVHIGCTIIDTLRFLIGEVSWVQAFPPFDGGSHGSDHSLHGILGFKNGPTACIIGCDLNTYVYSIFEIDIIGTHGRIKIDENGDFIYIYKPMDYKHYPGFEELKLVENIDTEMKWSMKFGLEFLLKDLRENRITYHFAEEGIKDLQVIESLKLSAEKRGERSKI